MIKTAYLAVLLVAGLLAFGLFSLVRGTQSDVPQLASSPAEAPAAVPATPEVDRLYFLRGIDLDQGSITLKLFNVSDSGSSVVVRDLATLKAAQDTAYVNTQTSAGQSMGSFALAMLGAPTTETFAQVFRDDVLIASVSCTNTACGSFASNVDVNYAGLLDAAHPVARVDESFSSYDAYLATIDMIAQDADFMLLDARPRSDFPLPRRESYIVVTLPTVITPFNDPLNTADHESRIQTALAGRLPEGTRLGRIAIADLGTAVIGDKDNNEAVLVDGATVTFPALRFYDVRVTIHGTDTLSAAFYDAITPATKVTTPIDAAFDAFVTERLNTTCVDCYFLKVDGNYAETARRYDMRSESYDLAYYDLREAP